MGTASVNGKAIRSSSTPLRSSIRRGWDEEASSIPTTCTSIEKLTRVGNEILYDMTIEDPDVFVEPWVMPTRVLRAGGGDAGLVPERAYCEVYETGNIATQLRH